MPRHTLTVILEDRPDLLRQVQALLSRQAGARVLHAGDHDERAEPSYRTQADGAGDDEPSASPATAAPRSTAP